MKVEVVRRLIEISCPEIRIGQNSRRKKARKREPYNEKTRKHVERTEKLVNVNCRRTKS